MTWCRCLTPTGLRYCRCSKHTPFAMNTTNDACTVSTKRRKYIRGCVVLFDAFHACIGLVHDSENHLRTVCASPMRTFRCTSHPIEQLLRDYSLGVIVRQFDATVDNGQLDQLDTIIDYPSLYNRPSTCRTNHIRQSQWTEAANVRRVVKGHSLLDSSVVNAGPSCRNTWRAF
jgi:hypothetical protein